MRRLIALLIVLLVGTLTLSRWRPGAETLTPTPPTAPTLLPPDFTLIPTFVPAYPCQLQNIDLYDEKVCRNERVSESVLVKGETVMFIQHDYHVGTGCWGSINQDIHELRVCDRASGATTTLTDSLVTPLLVSPSGEWLVYGTMGLKPDSGDAFKPHVYRVRSDGTDAARLDAQPFPNYAVGAPRDLRWLDDEWVAFSLWDGTQDGWHPFRLKADGSGVYEPLADETG